jgi:hypothetical protein
MLTGSSKGFKKLSLLIFLIFSLAGYSQVDVNSPYSRFGIGELSASNSTYSFSMGGISNALSSPFHVNLNNPASNANFDTLSFVFEGGLSSKFGSISTKTLSGSSNYASLGYLLFGFPVSGRIKVSIGLTPYSNLGYKIKNTELVPEIGNSEFAFEGTGGVNRFFIGASLKLHNNLAIGFSGSYLFGKLTRASSVVFPDSLGFINTKVDNQVKLGDLYYDFGVQYQKMITSKMTLGIGGLYAPAQKLSANHNYFVRSFFTTSMGIESFLDTIVYITDKGIVEIPEKYGVGIVLRNGVKWMVGADVDMQNWSKFKAFDVQDSLVNSIQIAIGGEYFPSDKSIDGYWKKIKYRAGFRYNKSHLFLQNTQIKDFGISFGFGFPLPRSLTTINLGFEIGRFGTKVNDLYQNNYFRVNLGVSVWERWFIKRKYY